MGLQQIHKVLLEEPLTELIELSLLLFSEDLVEILGYGVQQVLDLH